MINDELEGNEATYNSNRWQLLVVAEAGVVVGIPS